MPRGIPKTDEMRVEVIPNFRPFLGKLKIPVEGICDEPCTVYRVNNNWRKYFISAMLILDQPDIWDSADPDAILAARREVRELVGMSPCGCGTDPVGVQILNATNHDYQLAIEQLFIAGGIDAVAPDRPDTTYDTDSGDVDGEIYERSIALCWAVRDYVNTVIEQGIFSQIVPDEGVIIATSVTAFLLGPLAGVVYRVGIEIMSQLIQLVANDPDLINEVACCMLDGLIGETISEATFAASLDGCGFAALSDEDIVAFVIREGLDDQNNFLAFVKALGGYMSAANVLSDCPCSPPVCQTDFTIDEGGWTSKFGRALYVEDVGWDNIASGAFNHLIRIEFENDADWNLAVGRVLLKNTDSGDLRVLSRLRDAADVVLETVQLDIPGGAQGIVVNHNVATNFRRWDIQIFTIDFPDDNINCFITGADVIVGDCVFPTQPV